MVRSHETTLLINFAPKKKSYHLPSPTRCAPISCFMSQKNVMYLIAVVLWKMGLRRPKMSTRPSNTASDVDGGECGCCLVLSCLVSCVPRGTKGSRSQTQMEADSLSVEECLYRATCITALSSRTQEGDPIRSFF